MGYVMGISHIVDLMIAVYLVVVPSTASSQPATTSPDQPLQVETFGVENGPAVTGGFVILNGRYIPPPYKVERRGLGVAVNERVAVWPGLRRGQSPDPSDLQSVWLENAARTRRECEHNLASDYCLVFFEKGSFLSIDAQSAAFSFRPLMRQLKLLSSAAERTALLLEHGWGNAADPSELELFAQNWQPDVALNLRLDRLAALLLHEDDFGVTIGNSVNEGFVFIDGLYIDAPYTVVRRGLGIFINDQLVEPPALPWPSTLPSGDSDPPLPPQVGRMTSIHDSVISSWFREKLAYMQRHTTAEGEAVAIRRCIESLPCVKKSVVDPQLPDILVITTYSGETDNMSLRFHGGRRPAQDKASVLRRAEDARTRYERGLTGGECHFFSSGGGHVMGSAQSAQHILPEFMSLLKSPRPENEKIAEIVGAGLALGHRQAREVVRRFAPSPQLESRLAEFATKGKSLP